MLTRLVSALIIVSFYSFFYSTSLRSEELEYFSSYKNYHFANELTTWVQNKPFEECIAIQKAFFEWVYNPRKNRSSLVLVSMGDTWAKFRNKNINDLKSVMVFKQGPKAKQSGVQKFVFDTKKNNSGYIRLLEDSSSNIPKEKDLFKCFKKNEFKEYQNFLNNIRSEYDANVAEDKEKLFDFLEEETETFRSFSNSKSRD